MTTVIAKKHASGKIDIGWDSQVTCGPQIQYVEKVRTINGQMHVGAAGTLRLMNILHYTDVPSVHPSDLNGDFDASGYLVTTVVPAWIESLKNCEEKHLEKPDWATGMALVVIAGRIFSIGSDFSVAEIKDFGGIGSGSGYAIGAMAAGKSVRAALEISAELDPYTGGELSIAEGV